MAVPPITEFSGQMPDSLDSATFQARAQALFDWLVTEMAPETNVTVAAMNLAYNGEASTLDALTAVQASLAALTPQLVPVGSIHSFLGTSVPTGYLQLNRQTVLRADYAALWTWVQGSGAFDATGAEAGMFGPGDGSTSFDLPDLRGEFLRGWDDGRGVDASRAIGSSQADDFKAHSHEDTYNYRTSGGGEVAGSSLPFAGRASLNNGTRVISSDPAGGTENRPRNIAAMFCVKT